GGVERPERRGRERLVDRRGAQRVADDRRHRRCAIALSAHIAEEQPPRAGARGEQVVEVAADLVGGRDVVVRVDLESRYRGQARLKQGRLERGVDLAEPLTLEFRLATGTEQFRLVGAVLARIE